MFTFEIARDQIENRNIYIPWYSKIFRLIVAVFKIWAMLALILVVILISIAMIYSVYIGQFAFTLILTVIFLAVATLMNLVVDRYGD
jgi:polyferredoxin